MLKKMIISLLTATFLSSTFLVNPAHAKASEITISKSQMDKAIENLKDFGFDDESIERLPSSEVAKYSEIDWVGSKTKYFKFEEIKDGLLRNSTVKPEVLVKEITEEEFNNADISTFAGNENIAQNSYMKFEARAGQKGSDKHKFLIAGRATWKGSPTQRGNDIIGIGTSANLIPQQNTFYSEMTYKKSGVYTNGGSKSTPTTMDSNGAGVTWDIPNDSGHIIYQDVSIYLSFDANASISTSNLQNFGIDGQYKQQTSSLVVNPSFSFSTGGSISISASYQTKYKDLLSVYTSFNNK
ncbi:MAG: hypothetical protein E6583_07360 [Clostridium sp.]|nr:hypothetical protein [Clostridium celatum]MDU6341140.1 hypothetical protein [Clostridium sp.]